MWTESLFAIWFAPFIRSQTDEAVSHRRRTDPRCGTRMTMTSPPTTFTARDAQLRDKGANKHNGAQSRVNEEGHIPARRFQHCPSPGGL
jgi:hypothetical protein